MYASIGLINPKSRWNMGGCLRAAKCYNVSMVAMSGERINREFCNPGLTDTCKTYKHVPIVRTKNLKDVVPFSCVPVAIEFIEDSIPLQDYIHPERAFYIFGPEDGSISSEVRSWCKDTVYVPTTHCMNLAATVNVVLYDRMAKLGRHKK